MALRTAIPRQVIDAWPIEEAGLARRATNCLVRAGVRSVGQLRRFEPHQLLAIRTLGRVSLRDIQKFAEMTDDLVRGEVRLPSVREVFGRFLDQTELRVIEQRFGLLGSPSDPTIERLSLQAIGGQLGRTRERIRQCEETGCNRLRTRIARAYLEPFVEKLEHAINEHDRFLTAEESLVLAHDPDFARYHPAGLLLLFAELYGRFLHHHGFFTTVPEATLLVIEDELLRLLRQVVEPRPARDLASRLRRRGAAAAALAELPNGEAAAERILLQHPRVEATAEPAFFCSGSILLDMLAEVVRQLGGEAHYREATLRLNDRLHPTRQRGSGAVLKLLAGAPSRFRKIERARYALVEPGPFARPATAGGGRRRG